MRKESWVDVATVYLAAVLVAVTAAAAKDSLTLRVNDTKAAPGGIAAVVVRTYAPRGMEQGEICVTSGGGTKATTIGALPDLKVLGRKVTAKAVSGPFVALEAVDVYSVAGDATSTAAYDAASQMALLRFASASGTVNEGDGPLAVFYFRVSSAVTDGDRYPIDLNLAGTYLIDADGEPIEIEARGGRLEIKE